MNPSSLVVAGADVVTPRGVAELNVVIREGRIAELRERGASGRTPSSG